MGRPIALLAMLTAALLGSVACSDRGPDRAAADRSATDRATDACQLLEPSQLDRATGWALSVDGGDDSADAGRRSCEWIDAENASRAVQIRVEPGGRAEFDERRARAATALGGEQEVTLAGAETAFEVPDHGVVVALRGTQVVQVTVTGADATDQAARSIARTATDRLDRQ